MWFPGRHTLHFVVRHVVVTNNEGREEETEGCDDAC